MEHPEDFTQSSSWVVLSCHYKSRGLCFCIDYDIIFLSLALAGFPDL